MVSPTLAEKLSREELPVGWPWRFFLFSILIAATACMVYVGLVFGYRPFLDARIARQEEAFDELGRIVSQKQQDEFVLFYSQLANIQKLLENHIRTSSFFSLIEARTNTGVFYTKLEARIAERKIALEGTATHYGVFAQQLQAFSVAPEVASVIVNDSHALEGRVKFNLTLILKPSVFTSYAPRN